MPLKQTLAAMLICILMVSGCQETTEPTTTSSGDEAKFASFKEATQELVTLRNKIRDGFAAGDIDAAHGPLHEVGHILEELPQLAEKDGISGEQLGSVKQATEELFDAWGRVDATLHGQEGSTYDEEATAIEDAMNVVTGAAGVANDAGTAPAKKPDDTPPAETESAEIPIPEPPADDNG